MTTGFDDVGRFHHKFGLPSVTMDGARPRHPTPDLIRFRLNFLLEELQELLDSLGARIVGIRDQPGKFQIAYPTGDTPATPDHAKAFDSLMDLVYVAYGMAHIMGYPWHEGWFLVQRANMLKERAGEATASERGGTWDVIKPPGWTAPDIEGLLRNRGWGVPG